MTEQKPNDSTDSFEKALEAMQKKKYVLRLYVSGTTSRSARAITNLRNLCEEHLAGRYDLEVIDIYQKPDRAKDDQILATPTLVKSLPLPLRKFIGDLSETDRMLVGLDLVDSGE